MARSDPQINIRLGADLKRQIEEAARLSGRSVTAEIAHRLEFSLRALPATAMQVEKIVERWMPQNGYELQTALALLRQAELMLKQAGAPEPDISAGDISTGEVAAEPVQTKHRGKPSRRKIGNAND